MSVKLEEASPAVCEGCLSGDRRLIELDSLRNVFASILCDPQICARAASVCWECAALLGRVLRFRSRAVHAQRLLCASRQHGQFIQSEYSLSSLKCCTKSSYDGEYYFEERTPDLPELSLGENLAVSKEECTFDDSVEVDFAAEFPPELDYPVKLEPVDPEIFADLPSSIEIKKKKKKIKKNEKVKVKREVKKEKDYEETTRRKRGKASPFDNYTVTPVTDDELARQREAERQNPWYIKSPYKCESCIYGFRSLMQYNKHVSTNHSAEAGSFICGTCDTRAQTKQLLEKHIKIHREHYTCNMCGSTYGRIHMLRQHFASKHKTRKCKYCPEEFYDQRSLQQHRRSVHLNFQCDKCGKKTTSKYTLKKHLRTHEPYPCPQCDSVFSKKKNLDQHLRNRHLTRASEAYCVECDRQFASRPSYLLHVTEKHTTGVRFSCPECGKPFNRKIYMKNHYNLMHLKKTDYYCKLCDKYICRKDGLRKHIQFVHEGKRLPKNKMCDICGRGFSTNKTLIHHRRTHTGERPHQCEYCTAAFAQSTALKTHVKHIHMQLKRNNCRV